MAAVAARLLLDTHALLWWLAGDRRLSRRSRGAIETASVVLVSAATAWEIATKVRLGKLPGAVELAAELPTVIQAQGFLPLSISMQHSLRAGNLPGPHRDPFDRMLIAQSQVEDVPLITNEAIFDVYGVQRVW